MAKAEVQKGPLQGYSGSITIQGQTLTLVISPKADPSDPPPTPPSSPPPPEPPKTD